MTKNSRAQAGCSRGAENFMMRKRLLSLLCNCQQSYKFSKFTQIQWVPLHLNNNLMKSIVLSRLLTMSVALFLYSFIRYTWQIITSKYLMCVLGGFWLMGNHHNLMKDPINLTFFFYSLSFMRSSPSCLQETIDLPSVLDKLVGIFYNTMSMKWFCMHSGSPDFFHSASVLWDNASRCTCEWCVPFHCWEIFLCTDIPKSADIPKCWWIFGLFPAGSY